LGVPLNSPTEICIALVLEKIVEGLLFAVGLIRNDRRRGNYKR